jgi:putative copper export protein
MVNVLADSNSIQLAPALDAIRLSLHVLAAAIWVGGQIVMAGLVPKLRGLDQKTVKSIANQFAKMAWPAFIVLILTGLWNISSINIGSATLSWKIVFSVKIFLVVVTGVAAYVHGKTSDRKVLAVSGSIAGTSAIIVLILGILIAG